jgi:hypothetical protein
MALTRLSSVLRQGKTSAPTTRRAALALLIATACGVLLASCTPQPAVKSTSTDAIVLAYADFGPQAMAYETLGKQWFQWHSHGSSDPNAVDAIYVVVYRGVSLARIKARYPVVIGAQDYRYLDYDAALAYLKAQRAALEASEESEVLATLAARLAATQASVIAGLGPMVSH